METPSRWVLTFIDGGKAVLTTTEPLEREAYEHIMEIWDHWVKSDGQIMIIGDCRVERVGRIELEISTDAIIVHTGGIHGSGDVLHRSGGDQG